MVGCAFVPLQFTLHVNYLLREITEKRPHAKQILFEMTNQLTTFFIAITLTLIETNIETPNILSSELKSSDVVQASYNVKATSCVSWVSAVFLQNVFMKVFFQTVSLRFQNKGLTQAAQLLNSQTWPIKTFLKCKKTSEKHNNIGIV